MIYLSKSILFIIFVVTPCWAQTKVKDPTSIMKRLAHPTTPASLENLSIAVLDNGFEGFIPGIGMLPDSAEIITGPVAAPLNVNHGTGMAQIAWAAAGNSSSGPKFYLINSSGLSNFKAAVEFVISHHVDVVLYAQTWNYGGNFDGTGFVDALVGTAVASGVTWVNAAGNDHGMSFDSAVSVVGNALRLPGDGNTLHVETDLDDTEITIHLSWNDYTADDGYVAQKDLDLTLNAQDGTIYRSEKRPGKPQEDDPQITRFAREVITARVNRGVHRLHITSPNAALFNDTDRMRVVVTSDKPTSVKLKEATGIREIMPPADHPDVITVGDSSPASSVGPTVDGRQKPEIIVGNSRVDFTNGMQTAGTSNAAAIVAGAALLHIAHDPTTRGVALRNRMAGTDGALHCLVEIPSWHIDSTVVRYLPQAFRATRTAGGRQVVLTATAPEQLRLFRAEGARGAKSPEQAFFVAAQYNGQNPVTTQVVARESAASVPPVFVEVRQAQFADIECP